MQGVEGGASVSSVRSEEAALERTKRRAYPAFLLLFTLVVATNWFARDPDDVVVTVVYPVIVVVLLAAVPLLHTRRVRLRTLELAMFGFASLSVFLRNADLLFRPELGPQVQVLTGAQLWSLGLLVVGAFIMFERRLALRIGAGLVGLSLALTVAALGLEASRGQLTGEATLYLLRVHVLLALLLILVSVATTIREQYHRAVERAALLEERALTDPLTGIANRHAGQERLEAEIADSRRRGRPLSVVMVDLDRFKSVNDTYGHVTGDAVLVAVATAIVSTLRTGDLVARWGGEEFLLVLPETSAAVATDVAERCRRTIADLHPEGLRVSATLGVAELVDGETTAQLLKRADVGLYQGKHDGRDRTSSGPDVPWPHEPAGEARP
ncbi:MAG: diguanylate cyclase domain-containing protein [Actinomycetota bacterium]